MNFPGILSIFALLAFTAGGRAEHTQPVPAGVKATLEFDRAEYFLGENVLAHFILENAGTEPFTFSWGGDYRGSSRHLRFEVTATDEAGILAEDPDPSPMNFGGLGSSPTLAPGQKFPFSLPLVRYRMFDQPGRYLIRVTHDFGWKEGIRPHPVAEATVVFAQPDAAQAEQVVADMEKLPEDADSSLGERTRAYADFTALRQPVYLAPLQRRAAGGNSRALAGIARIETTGATAALIKLAGHKDEKFALDAALTLNGRLPDPEFEGKLPGRGPFRFDALEARRRIARLTWEAPFAPEVRALAKRFLERTETRAIGCGAFMIESVGTVEDVPEVKAALDRAIGGTINPRREPAENILNDPEPLGELMRAMQALHGRGYTLGEDLSGDADILLRFAWLAGQPGPRTPRWQSAFDAFCRAAPYAVREAALKSIPQPIPEPCKPAVLAALADRDLGVVRTACGIAGASGDPQFLPPLLEIIATETHEWVLREASNAATQLGAGFDLLQTWTTRLGDERLYDDALTYLQITLKVPTGGHSGRTDLTRAERLALRREWEKFLAKHEKILRTGRRFSLDDPAVTPALFGRARTFTLPDGRPWPPEKSDR